ncbi:MAG: glycine zipper 2TM domain-containing protein [Geobacter sp.]|nr:glycine zipper 2TM domain-containing protein [Geobacter sp.]
MKMKIAALFTLAAFVLGASGCVTVSEEHKGAATGAGLGGVTGAVAGAVLAGEGSRTKGALIGGLAGAVLGGVIGNYTVDKKKDAQETSNKYAYSPSAGTVVRIESADAKPSVLAQGGTVNLVTSYAVMSPSSENEIAITESREVTLNGELIGSPEANVSRTPGTYQSSVPLILAADAKKGKYRVITTIKSAAGKDSRESSFTVQ